MAHFKRKYSRCQTAGYYSANGLEHRLGRHDTGAIRLSRWTSRYPRYWDKLHHARPARRETHRLIQAILHGEDPDGLVWPDGRKPHIYYW